MALTESYKKSIEAAISELNEKNRVLNNSFIIPGLISELEKCISEDKPLSYNNWQAYDYIINKTPAPADISGMDLNDIRILINDEKPFTFDFIPLYFHPFGSEHSRAIYDEALTPSALAGDIGGIKSVIRGLYRVMRDTTLILMPLITAPIKIAAAISQYAWPGFIKFYELLDNQSDTTFDSKVGEEPPDTTFGSKVSAALRIALGVTLGIPLGLLLGTLHVVPLAVKSTLLMAKDFILSAVDLVYDNLLKKPYNLVKSLFNNSNVLQNSHQATNDLDNDNTDTPTYEKEKTSSLSPLGLTSTRQKFNTKDFNLYGSTSKNAFPMTLMGS